MVQIFQSFNRFMGKISFQSTSYVVHWTVLKVGNIYSHSSQQYNGWDFNANVPKIKKNDGKKVDFFTKINISQKVTIRRKPNSYHVHHVSREVQKTKPDQNWSTWGKNNFQHPGGRRAKFSFPGYIFYDPNGPKMTCPTTFYFYAMSKFPREGVKPSLPASFGPNISPGLDWVELVCS